MAVIQDMWKDAPDATIREEVNSMQLGPVNAFLTGQSLRMLRRRAYTKEQFERLATMIKLPSYDQVRREIHRLKSEPELVAVLDQAKALPRARESPQSFALSIPAPALLTQVDEHSLELYVVTPDGIAVTSRVHAAVLVCVKTAAISSVCSVRILVSNMAKYYFEVHLRTRDQHPGEIEASLAAACADVQATVRHPPASPRHYSRTCLKTQRADGVEWLSS